MVHDFQPSRQKTDLAEVVEMLLDKGIVINADIAVSIGDTQLLGVQVRAAIASFETAAKYGLEFPEGTDMRRVAEAAGDPELAEVDRPNPVIDPTRGVNVTADESETDRKRSDASESDDGSTDSSGRSSAVGDEERVSAHLGARPNPDRPTSGGFELLSDESGSDAESGDEAGSETDSSDDGAESPDESETGEGAPEAAAESEDEEP
ncbi:gas vesicle protein GvpJ [Natrinema longum]|uniref:Gas vesicle protein n=1 Tax=Natrinema longum TaxID=370324 RepID=A0A8A2U7D7_9EURY|nr:gas vesicle protein GvpJ [Natrinema longum]MBZ6494045.1 gas vesicle protein [Natrinema longum]QSW84620.1 gas vesicle protein [Natrinema longum]